MRWFTRTDFRSFYFLNATQFLGALNDNIFKLLVIYLLINVKGATSASSILSLAGAIFVIPFLLFSSGAGVLADRISKRTIIVTTKIMELVIMIAGFLAVYYQSEFGVYSALFLMATQSALFGPSKYGIIPELVEPKKVSKANGSMTSFTYLAIILGTFLASFITDITHKNFLFVAGFCVLVAVIGLLTSLGIVRTAPQMSTKKINPIFVYEIYQTLKLSWKVPHLLTAIFGSSFFLFIGAFTQLNIIPFAMESLHLSEVGGGYLFLATAVGIAIGAVLAGQLSKDRVEPGISCSAGFFISFFFFLLYFFSSSLVMTIIILACLGIVGGGYLIPFDSFIQVNSPDEKRGQVIAASNFFSFIGVLLASLFLYALSGKLQLTAASGFAFMGLASFLANLVITGRLSSFFFPFFANKVLKRFRIVKVSSNLPDPEKILILQSSTWWDALLLFGLIPNLKILRPDRYVHRFPWINGWIDSIRLIPPDLNTKENVNRFAEEIKKQQKKNELVCVFFHKKKDNEQIIEDYKKGMGRFRKELCFIHGTKERIAKRALFFTYHQKQITMSFQDKA
jgi:acyl-[acyl-carrier-protein]-phospholipid O-acyltransferase/long-chain-fatty-acid--[acyl-carrier-protein] ligase